MLPSRRLFWKKAVFQTIAHIEPFLRSSHPCSVDELRQIRNFLILQYESPLGSIVHATPLFEALKQAMPDSHITIAASGMAVSVLQHNPYIDRCIVTPNPFADFRDAVRVVRGLLQAMPAGPRCVITTVGNQRTRLALLSLFAVRAVRIGYTLAPELYDAPLSFHPERGQIVGNLDIARRLGHDVPFYEPSMFFTGQDAERAAQWLTSPAMQPDAPRVAFVTQNSGGQRNQWSMPRFRQVISDLAKIRNAVPVFLGTAGDAIAIEELRRDLPDRGISLAGKTMVPELAAVLAQCDLVISLDTGTFHLARAAGLPGIVLSQAWQSPLEWLPVDHPRYRVLRGSDIQEYPPDYWIHEVSAEQVVNAAIELLTKYPAAATQRTERVQHCLR